MSNMYRQQQFSQRQYTVRLDDSLPEVGGGATARAPPVINVKLSDFLCEGGRGNQQEPLSSFSQQNVLQPQVNQGQEQGGLYQSSPQQAPSQPSFAQPYHIPQEYQHQQPPGQEAFHYKWAAITSPPVRAAAPQPLSENTSWLSSSDQPSFIQSSNNWPSSPATQQPQINNATSLMSPPAQPSSTAETPFEAGDSWPSNQPADLSQPWPSDRAEEVAEQSNNGGWSSTTAPEAQTDNDWQSGSEPPLQNILNRGGGMMRARQSRSMSHQPLPTPAPVQQQDFSFSEAAVGPSSQVVNPHSSSQQPQQHDSQESAMATDLHEASQTVQVKLRDIQGDPNSPLHSVKSFEELGLSQEVLQGLYGMSYSRPSKIQERALPLMLSNPHQNLIAQSQSGTGKTAAFVLAMLSRVDTSIQAPQAICLAPSRELARQLLTVIQNMSKYTKITSVALIKDAFKKQKGEVDYLSTRQPLNYHIIVGTPGIIMECLRRRGMIYTTKIKLFVLDEADNMLDQDGLGDQSIRIRNMIKAENPQILLFSATFPEYVYDFAHRFAKNPNEITLSVDQLNVEGIKQYYMDCIDENHKYEVLCGLYDLLTVSQSIIFCKMRITAEEIAKRMKAQGHNVGFIHGNMTSGERDKVIDDFRRGEFKVLITTNLIARGIDISQVSLVVNYDMPLDRNDYPDAEVYLHRIGRTGRFGRIGISVIFVHNNKTFQDMRFIEEHFKISIERVPTEDWEEVERIFKKVL